MWYIKLLHSHSSGRLLFAAIELQPGLLQKSKFVLGQKIFKFNTTVTGDYMIGFDCNLVGGISFGWTHYQSCCSGAPSGGLQLSCTLKNPILLPRVCTPLASCQAPQLDSTLVCTSHRMSLHTILHRVLQASGHRMQCFKIGVKYRRIKRETRWSEVVSKLENRTAWCGAMLLQKRSAAEAPESRTAPSPDKAAVTSGEQLPSAVVHATSPPTSCCLPPPLSATVQANVSWRSIHMS